MTKKCNNCGKTKELIYFYGDKHNPDGFKNVCIHCTRSVHNQNAKRSPIEEFFKKTFGSYPTSENEIKQFQPYFKEKKVNNYFNK